MEKEKTTSVKTRFSPVDHRSADLVAQKRRMTAADITEASDTWASFNGFEGAQCSNCDATANVFRCAPGWFCPQCGYFNNQRFSGGPMPLKHPDYGPTARVVYKGVRRSKWFVKWARKSDSRFWRPKRFWRKVKHAIHQRFKLFVK